MRRLLLGGMLALALGTTGAAAQDATVEVRTWSGDSWTLNSPTLDMLYTVVPPPQAGIQVAPSLNTQSGIGNITTVGPGTILVPGTIQGSVRSLLPPGPDSKQGRRHQDTVTVVKDDREIRVPLANIAEIVFTREPVKSTLMPHVARDHFRHAATVRLVDGSIVTGDYVNLGTAVLRGTTPQGSVELPWQQIEFMRFQR